ncbi:hypothetical protein DB347_02540 [Opitutaceae bacterium EW11]|nr:hypothetical protein DB347_02540 [Opitutaceae bacterium EW11]
MLLLAYWMVARSCGYDHAAVARYGMYMIVSVWLPGVVVLRFAQKHPVSFLESLAVGVPIGFAIEILTFFATSAAHVRPLLPYLPLIWVGLFFLQWHRTRRAGRSFGRMGHGSPVMLLSLAAFSALMVFSIVCRFYAGSPLAGGVLSTATHHDWAYLLSRAAEIKQHWPLGDPSLAGAPLTYHYFLLVHIAAASLVTGVSLDLVAFRLFVLPLAAVLTAQVFVLGKDARRSPWAGVLAVCLVLAADELSFVASADHSTFGNLFVRWLFISPTFFFGMVFSGALILWIHRLVTQDGHPWPSFAVLALLSAIATGAKGTVVPPLILALGVWLSMIWFAGRRFPWRGMVTLAFLGVGFSAVYFSTLAAWGTGAASFYPFASFGIAGFWTDHLAAWTQRLEGWGLPAGASRIGAMIGCGAVVSAGFCGVRLLALRHMWTWKQTANPSLVLWLGLIALMYFAFGQFLSLDSQSQLYLFFPIQLPAGVLAAAEMSRLSESAWVRVLAADRDARLHLRRLALLAVVAGAVALVAADVVAWWHAVIVVAAFAFVVGPAKESGADKHGAAFARFLWRMSPMIALAVLLAVQVNHWRLRSIQGFNTWCVEPKRTISREWALLLEGMTWIRSHTPKESVILANAFTARNVRPGGLACIDDTTVDKYYYYSALAERRLWVEGPAYVLNQPEAVRRLEEAAEVFYDGMPASLLVGSTTLRPQYLLIDRLIADDAKPNLADSALVFENARLSVYRLGNVGKGGQFAAVGAPM